MIHVPMWVKNKFNIVSRSIPRLRETLGREPTCEEIAAQVAVDTDSKVRLWRGDIGRASDLRAREKKGQGGRGKLKRHGEEAW